MWRFNAGTKILLAVKSKPLLNGLKDFLKEILQSSWGWGQLENLLFLFRNFNFYLIFCGWHSHGLNKCLCFANPVSKYWSIHTKIVVPLLKLCFDLCTSFFCLLNKIVMIELPLVNQLVWNRQNFRFSDHSPYRHNSVVMFLEQFEARLRTNIHAGCFYHCFHTSR